MNLQHTGSFNDLSPKLRKELEEKVQRLGKTVRYKFDISNPNPDPTFHNGKILWPHLYTLDPAVFNIIDPYEEREGKSKSKRIGLIEGVDEKGNPSRFKKIKVYDRTKGVFTLHPKENPEDFEVAMFMEMHPKLVGGKFADKSKRQMVTRIDELAAATEQRELRTAKNKARRAAEELSDKEVVDFADAMLWDSAQEVVVLRNEIEQLAEQSPEFFNDLVEGKRIEYQAAVKQALNKNIIIFDPAEYKFSWASNNQPIAILSATSDKSEVEKMGEWLATGGDKETKTYQKIKALIAGTPVPA